MKALIFAAGLGTRLKPFTLEHPKALVPVAGVPMLQRVIEKLRRAGITDMVVNVHHFAQQIIDFLRDNDNFGCNIRISDESSLLLDTGGGLLAARPQLDGDELILVHNADILTDFHIADMLADHLAGDRIASLLASDRQTSRYLLTDTASSLLRGWINTKTSEVLPQGIDTDGLKPVAFDGVHILSPRIFPFLESYRREVLDTVGDVPFSITPFYIWLCQRQPVGTFTPKNPFAWFDVGRPESLALAEKSLL